MKANIMRRVCAVVVALVMVLVMFPIASTHVHAASATYTLDVTTDLTAFAQGAKADGDTEVINSYFTVHYSAKNKVDSSGKTFEDGYTASQRLNFGGKTNTSSWINSVEFSAANPATVKIWWVSGGDSRTMAIYNAEGTILHETVAADSIKNSLYITEFALAEAGKYYIGVPIGSNYLFKVEVTETESEAGHVHEYTSVVTAPTCEEDGYTTFTCSCGFSYEGEPVEALGHTMVDGTCTTCGKVDPTAFAPGDATYTFDPATQVTPGTDKDPIAADTIYADGMIYTTGSVTQRVNASGVYCVEVQKNATGALVFKVTGTADVTMDVSSTGSTNISAVAIVDEAGNTVANNEALTEVTGSAATTLTYTALPAGTYKIVSPSSSYGRGVRVHGVTIAHSTGSEPEVPEVTEVSVLLKPNDNWLLNGARFAVYYYDGVGGEGWVDAVDSDGDGYYEATITSNYANLIFCRMDPATTENSWTTKWNQTADLTLPTDENNVYYVPVGDWDSSDNTNWGLYGNEPDAPEFAGYTVAGEEALVGTAWDPSQNLMTETSAGIWQITFYNIPAGEYQFKVTDGTWTNSWGTVGTTDNYMLSVPAKADITITFNADTKEITVDQVAVPVEETLVLPVGETPVTLVPGTTYTLRLDLGNLMDASGCALAWNADVAITVNGEAIASPYDLSSYNPRMMMIATVTAETPVVFTVTVPEVVTPELTLGENAIEVVGEVVATFTAPEAGEYSFATAEGEVNAYINVNDWAFIIEQSGSGVVALEAGQTINVAISSYDYSDDTIDFVISLVPSACDHANAVYVEAVPATHTTNGTAAYYNCADCGCKVDALGVDASVLTDEELVLLATGHIRAELVAGTPATHTANGTREYYYCADCDAKFEGRAPEAAELTDEELVLLATGHIRAEKVAAVAATCTTDGNVEYYHCAECNANFEGRAPEAKEIADVVVPATGHVYVDGTCANCGEKIAEKGVFVKENGQFNYYVEDVHATDYTGLVEFNGYQWYVADGVAVLNKDGYIVLDGTTYRLKAGRVDGAATGLYYVDGVWTYFSEGVIDTEYAGFVAKGTREWYVENGQINFNKTGVVDGRYVKYGEPDTSFTGLVKHEGSWIYIESGLVNSSFTGTATLNNMVAYVENGVVDFTFSGEYNGMTFKYGIAQ